MKLQKLAGATSEIWQVFIRDSSSTTGAGLTGLAHNTASLTAYYHRDTDTTATAITLVTMTVGTFTSSGFKEIDATNMPGWYQFCPPNAALASGAKSCAFHLKGATNMAPLPIEVQLTAVNPDSATAFITGINSLAPPTNFNLLSIDASGRIDLAKWIGVAPLALSSQQVQAVVPNTQKVDVETIKTQAVTLSGGVTIPAATLASTTNITAGTIATVSGNVNGNVGGNVTGSVGSVVGAVGSVTGNVGGNVVGSVGSVTAGVTVTTNNDKTGYRLSATGVDDILDEVVQGTATVRQLLGWMGASTQGVSSGYGTGTVTFYYNDGTTAALIVTISAGNRTAITRA